MNRDDRMPLVRLTRLVALAAPARGRGVIERVDADLSAFAVRPLPRAES